MYKVGILKMGFSCVTLPFNLFAESLPPFLWAYIQLSIHKQAMLYSMNLILQVDTWLLPSNICLATRARLPQMVKLIFFN